jgi:hypothetical protein
VRARSLWILIAVGFATRAVYALALHQPLFPGDELHYYVQHGQHFDAWWASGDTFRPPGYPLFVALTWKLGGLGLTRVAQSLVVSLACAGAALVAARRFGLPAGRAAAALAILYLPLTTIAGPVISDALGGALFAIGILLLDEALHQRTRWTAWIAAAGACLAAAALIRPNLTVGLVVLSAVALASTAARGRRWATALAIILPVMVLFGPYVGRNYAVAHKLAPIGDNDNALIIGLSLPVDRQTGRSGPALRDAYYSLPPAPGKPPRFTAMADRDPLQLLKTNITKRPLEQLSTSWFWIREMWLWPWDDRLDVQREPLIPWPLLLASHLLYLCLAAAGVWLTRRDSTTRLVALTTVALTLPFAFYQSAPRMAIAALILLLIPAGVALAAIARRAVRLTAEFVSDGHSQQSG